MDHPSIIKLLEDDVDESMHSGAAVEALSAALNRDIGGDSSTFSKPSDCQSVGVLPPANTQPKQEQSDAQHSEQQSSEIAKQEVKDQAQKEETKVVKTEENDQAKASDQTSLQLPKQENFQQVKAEPQNSTVNEANGAKRIRTAAAPSSSSSSPSIPFQLLIPIIRPHLDKDRSMQLQSVFSKLRTNEVSKEDFLRVIRNIIGDQMLRQAVNKVHTQLQTQAQNQASKSQQPSPNPIPLQHQASQQQIFPHGPHQYPSPRALSSLPIGTSQSKNVSSNENNGQRSRETESNRNFPNQEVNKQQQPPQRPQTSFPMGGGIPSNFNSHPYARPSMNASPASLRPHATQQGTIINVPNYELQNIANGTNRLHGGPMQSNSNSSWQAMANKEQRSNSLPTPMPYMKQEGADLATDNPNKSQIAPATQDGPSFGNPAIGNLNHDPMKQTSRMGFPNNVGTQANYRESVSQISSSFGGPMAKTPPKKPMVGQKKPLEGPATSAAMASKKQKTAGTGHDQSIDQLNDVTAVSGVDLRAEEEQLLSAPREDSRATEALRKIVQEEEEKLILQKGPLQTKLTDIMLKSGLKKIGSDVERCISLCLEERLRGVIGSLIRLSKQRVDSEKPRHHFVITSDVGRHILDINNKVKEEWDKKQAEEAEKQKKINDVEGNTGSDGEDNDGRSKANKVNKDEDDKMRANAANVAARAAVGGDDMLSKWQLMAEQARQKREGHDAPSPSSQPVKPTSSKTTSSNLRRNLKAPQGSHKRGVSVTGGNRKLGRSAIAMSQPKVVRNITRKDVIAFLRREPQMTKSTLLYRLYNKSSSDSTIE